MKNFFMTYKVLFAAVWEEVLPEDALQDYFRGFIGFRNLIHEFSFYDTYYDNLNRITTPTDLEKFIRQNKIYDMND